MNTLRACHLPDADIDSPPMDGWLLCRLWLIACVLLFANIARAVEAVDITGLDIAEANQISTNFQPAQAWLEYYDPGLQKPDLATLQHLPDNKWHNVAQIPASMALNARHTLWFRMSLQNRGEPGQTLILQDTNILTDALKVYVVGPDGETREGQPQQTGNQGTYASRIFIPANTSRTLYISATGYHSPHISFTLSSENGYRREQYDRQLFFGLVNGMILGLTAYNLLLGLKTRQTMYYAFSVLGIANLATIAVNQNTLNFLIPALGPALNNDLKAVFPHSITICLVTFLQVFFESGKNNPRAHAFLNVYKSVLVVIVVAFLAGTPMYITSPVYAVFAIAATIVLYYLCLTNLQHRRSSMIMAVFGLSMPLLAGLITVMAASGNMPQGTPYTAIVMSTHVLELLAFSLAMANRIQQLQDMHEYHVQSASEARIISDAHNRLLAHLNHELRTPLNGILGAAEILLHKAAPDERHIFSMIHQTALPLKHLIDDMINIRAITENRQSLQHIRFDLQTLLQECMDIFLPTAHNKHIRLFFRIGKDIATDVTGDPHRLRQILLNLIGNACKFTSDGEVGVQVSKMKAVEGNIFLYQFEVTDSGMGISKADEQRLFQSFETGSALSSQQSTGLGLSIVHELSELLGGNCGYSNQPPVGSRFWFTAALTPHSHSRHKPNPAFSNASILLADESRVIREQLIEHINNNIQHITGAATTDAVLQALESVDHELLVIHKPLLTESVLEAIHRRGLPALVYIDQGEALQEIVPREDLPADIIVRHTSIDHFARLLEKSLKEHARPGVENRATESAERKPHVLVADDIETNQFIIQAMLESLGIQPVICDNGKQAFALYCQHQAAGTPFDAILMDCEMPVQDGFETTRQIRIYEQETGAHRVNIIALTAHTETAYRQRSETCGMDLYLTKPVTLESMRHHLLAIGRTAT